MTFSRLLILAVVVVASACETKTEGGISAVVDFTRVDRGRACIRVAVVDLASVGSQPERFVAHDVDVSDRELTGSITVGIVRNPEWTDGVEVRASLHRNTCATVPEAVESARATFELNSVKQLRLVLRQSPFDGGAGGGAAGGDAGGSAGGSAAGGSAAGGSAAGGSAAGGSAAGGSAAGGSAAGG
ncbi:MAG: hypothetical protein IAE78_33300, partial [Myxococcus sp.]|nr:hypothetical protein [Myxococcus sp.]